MGKWYDLIHIFKSLWILKNKCIPQKYPDLCLSMVSWTHIFMSPSSRRSLIKMIAKKFKKTNLQGHTWVHRRNKAKRSADKILEAVNQIVIDLRRWNICRLHWGKPRSKFIYSGESGRAWPVTVTSPTSELWGHSRTDWKPERLHSSSPPSPVYSGDYLTSNMAED